MTAGAESIQPSRVSPRAGSTHVPSQRPLPSEDLEDELLRSCRRRLGVDAARRMPGLLDAAGHLVVVRGERAGRRDLQRLGDGVGDGELLLDLRVVEGGEVRRSIAVGEEVLRLLLRRLMHATAS